VLHGAGSFGHFQAREHAVSKGVAHPSFSWRGFALTRASVSTLNGHVVDALLSAGVVAVGVHPFPTFETRGKGHVPPSSLKAGLARVRAVLQSGLMPVLHGDAVLDELHGCSILSGDTLMVLLATDLRPRLAVFLTDVAGVYDRPPQLPGAQLLTKIVVRRDGSIRAAHTGARDQPEDVGATGAPPPLQTSTAAHDVTGGLAAKLEAAAQIAAGGTPVVIVQVGTEHAEAALRGEYPAVCTVVVRD
jgi:isopentenyl phosphate kinase